MIEITTDFRNYILNTETFYTDSIQLRKDTTNRIYTFIYGDIFEVDYIYNSINNEFYLTELAVRILREPDIQINYYNDVQSRLSTYYTRIQGWTIDEDKVLFDLIPKQIGTNILYRILNNNFDLLTTDINYDNVPNHYYILNNFRQTYDTRNETPENNGRYYNGASGPIKLTSYIVGINYKINAEKEKEITGTLRDGKKNILSSNSVFTTSILGYNASINISKQNIYTYEENIYTYTPSWLFAEDHNNITKEVWDNSSRITNYYKPLKDDKNNTLNNLIYYPKNPIKVAQPETFGSTATYYGTTLRYITQQENDITNILDTMNVWISLNALNITLGTILTIALGFSLYSFLKRDL